MHLPSSDLHTSNVIVGFNNSSNNLLHVKSGAALNSIGGIIGRAGNSDNNTVRLSDAGTTWTLSGNPASTGLTLGNEANADDNSLIVENGALLRSAVELRANRGTVHLNGATIDLTYGAGADQALAFQAAGRLRGQGTLKASGVSSSAVGAIVEIGEGTFGVLNTELTGASWNNTNIRLELGVGNITGSPLAGTDYDLLNITGSFTFGGSLEIDLTEAVVSSVYDFALIKWTSFSGDIESLNVDFINGDALNYEIRADGFYVYAVPEPSVVSLLLGLSGMFAVGVYRRKKRN